MKDEIANKTGNTTIQCMYEIDIEDILKEFILQKMFECNRPILNFNFEKSAKDLDKHFILYYLQLITFNLKPFIYISEMQGRCT